MDCIALASCTHTGAAASARRVSAVEVRREGESSFQFEPIPPETNFVIVSLYAKATWGSSFHHPSHAPPAPVETNLPARLPLPPSCLVLRRRESRFYGTNDVGLATTYTARVASGITVRDRAGTRCAVRRRPRRQEGDAAHFGNEVRPLSHSWVRNKNGTPQERPKGPAGPVALRDESAY